jgi:branched-subunit amino acid transport protein
MNGVSVFQVIVGASVISFALRALPFLGQDWFAKLPAGVIYFIHLCGYGIIGSMMADAAFAPYFGAEPKAGADVALRLACTGAAALFMVRTRRQVISLALGYAAFVMLYSYLGLGRV